MKAPLKLPMWVAGIASVAMLCACVPLSWYALERFQSDAVVFCVMLLPCAPFLLLRLRGPVELPEVPPPLVEVSVDKGLRFGADAGVPLRPPSRLPKPRRRRTISPEGAAFGVAAVAGFFLADIVLLRASGRGGLASGFDPLLLLALSGAALVAAAGFHLRRLNRDEDDG